MFIYPYKKGSNSVKELSKLLGAKQIKLENSKFKGSQEKLVINWGNSNTNEEVEKCVVLNKPEAVKLASNKLSFFLNIREYNNKHIQGVVIPEFTSRKEMAARYFNAGYTIVCRTVLNGHSGEGIVLMDPARHNLEDMPDCELYVLYIKKKSEYRVHVLNGQVVDVQKKVRRMDVPNDMVNWKIRNHDNGFVYARNEHVEDVPPNVTENSVRAIAACGLNFGAVDVIYNENEGMSYVLEVNTAPGLTGETLAGYQKRFAEIEDAFKEDRMGLVAGIIANFYGGIPDVEPFAMPPEVN